MPGRDVFQACCTSTSMNRSMVHGQEHVRSEESALTNEPFKRVPPNLARVGPLGRHGSLKRSELGFVVYILHFCVCTPSTSFILEERVVSIPERFQCLIAIVPSGGFISVIKHCGTKLHWIVNEW